MIPAAAVEAAAEWLPHSGDCEVRPERDCTCRKPRVAIMRAALEAAAPHMLGLEMGEMTIVDQTVELAEIIRGDDDPEVSVLGVAEAIIAAGYRKVGAEADVWDEGWAARASWPAISTPNPYRPTE